MVRPLKLRSGDKETPKQQILAVVLSFLFGAMVFVFIQLFNLDKFIEELELKTFDMRVFIQQGVNANKPSKDIVVVKFDDPTLRLFEEDFGTWPWPRGVHASIIQYLNQAKAKAIAYDIMFVSRKRNESKDDQALVDAFRKYKNVYLSMNFDNDKAMLDQLGKGLSNNDIELLKPLALKFENHLNPGSVAFNLDPTGFFNSIGMNYNNYRKILPELLQTKERIAFVNHTRDKDGVSRSNPLIYRFFYPEWAVSEAKPFKKSATGFVDQKGKPVREDGVMLDKQGNPIKLDHMLYFPYLGLQLIRDLKLTPAQREQGVKITEDGYFEFPGYRVPLTADGAMLIKWYNVNVDQEYLKQQLDYFLNIKHSAKKLSDIQLNAINQAIQNLEASLRQPFLAKPYREISAWKLLKAIHDEATGQVTKDDLELKAYFKDKIIFIGTTAVSTYDIKTTPINNLLPGVILQATIFDNLFQNKSYMQRISVLANIWITGLLCIICALLIVKLRSALAGMLTMISILTLYVIIAIFIFQNWNLWLNIATPIVSVVVTTTLTFMVKYISRTQDLEETYKLATTDSMTGLKNHRFFQEHMLESIEQANRLTGKFSLLLVDIDFFKKFNDTYGHQAGDEVLRHVAQRLKHSVRSNDLVARYGGEEMAIVLSRTPEVEAVEVGRKLVRAVGEGEYTIAGGVKVHITISVGVATYPTHGEKPSELIEFADQGLYRAKENGRNQVGAQYNNTPLPEMPKTEPAKPSKPDKS